MRSKFENIDQYKTKFIIAVLFGATIGFLIGALKSMDFIMANQYIGQQMYYLTVYWFTSIINKYMFITLVVAGLVLIVLVLIQAFLDFIGTDKKYNNVIMNGVVPALLLFIVGGYWINKQYLPGFYELKSIIGNALWLLTSAFVGWLIWKISRTKFSTYLKIHALKILVAIFCLVISLNLGRYLYSQSLDKDRPSVILISIDTLRADHLSCYGYSRNTSPNIDRFAEDGVLFKNTIAQSSFTLPSHMSMLTGLYPSSHGVILEQRKLGEEHSTLAEVLQNAGYQTVAFTDGGYLSYKYNYQGFHRFDDQGQGIESIYSKAVDWLKDKPDRPFFLFLHTYEPHSPYVPPPAYDIYSDKNYRGIVDVSVGERSKYYQSIKSQMTLEDYLYVIDKYDGEIYYTDHFLGRLFEGVKDLGLYENSIIILTSDHGEHFFEHPHAPAGYVGHFELYDEIVKVPLIIKASQLPEGRIVDQQVESIDIMPTVLELLGISLAHESDGENLIQIVEEDFHDDDKRYSFSERYFSSPDEYDGYSEYKMIRKNDWKLLLRSAQGSGALEIELYNLQSDPREKGNLVAEEKEMGKYLFAKLQAWTDIQGRKSYIHPGEEVKLDDELVEQLKALGYIN